MGLKNHRGTVMNKVVFFALISLLSSAAVAQQTKPTMPDLMDHKVDDPARYATAFDEPARDAWQLPSRVIDALQLRSGMKVADIGDLHARSQLQRVDHTGGQLR